MVNQWFKVSLFSEGSSVGFEHRSLESEDCLANLTLKLMSSELSYLQLNEKLELYFPDQPANLYWQKNENDLTPMNSEADFQNCIAIERNQGQVIRLILVKVDKSTHDDIFGKQRSNLVT